MDIIIKQVGGDNIDEETIKNIVYNILLGMGFDNVDISVIHFGTNNLIGTQVMLDRIK